jgi:hypothetical protein
MLLCRDKLSQKDSELDSKDMEYQQIKDKLSDALVRITQTISHKP